MIMFAYGVLHRGTQTIGPPDAGVGLTEDAAS